MVSSPNDFYWKSGESNFRDALVFLVQARKLVQEQKIPKGRSYRQFVHSDDKFVGTDIYNPAILDASYSFHEKKILSVSLPNFTQIQENYRLKHPYLFKLKTIFDSQAGPGKLIRSTGFSLQNFEETLNQVLNNLGVIVQEPKIGEDTQSETFYIEFDVNPDNGDYDKGRKIIQAFVHSNANTPEELLADIKLALKKEEPEKTPKTISVFKPPNL